MQLTTAACGISCVHIGMHSLHKLQPPAQQAHAAAAAAVVTNLLCDGLETIGVATPTMHSLNRWPAPQSCHAYSCHQCWSICLHLLTFAQQHPDPAAVRVFATSHHRLDACRQTSPAIWPSRHTHSLHKPWECSVCCQTCCSVSCGVELQAMINGSP